MSELITATARPGIRWQLLTTVCAMTLLSGVAAVAAEQDTRPTVWIELGGQLERLSGTAAPFTPDFALKAPQGPLLHVNPLKAQTAPRYSRAGEIKLVVQPEHSDWVFSAGLRYGRSNGKKYAQHQTDFPPNKNIARLAAYPSFSYSNTVPANLANFSEARVRHDESHMLLDFKAGKDVGLGAAGGQSTLSLGVRFAQFSARARADLKARPDLAFYNGAAAFSTPDFYFYKAYAHFHAYTATGRAARNFRGVGPSLSWEGATPVAGHAETTEVALDWGINAAVLFGRQIAKVSHQSTARNFRQKYYPRYVVSKTGGSRNASRSVVVPNVGAFAGLSVKFPNSKVSFGYRGDLFFGAMDVGLDAAKRQMVSFHGPYAKVSVGFD